jgi:hypothetical protein
MGVMLDVGGEADGRRVGVDAMMKAGETRWYDYAATSDVVALACHEFGAKRSALFAKSCAGAVHDAGGG